MVSKCQTVLDPDQDCHCVGPDLSLNCLQRLSADEKSQAGKQKVKEIKMK